jgi:hypothetical protein
MLSVYKTVEISANKPVRAGNRVLTLGKYRFKICAQKHIMLAEATKTRAASLKISKRSSSEMLVRAQ